MKMHPRGECRDLTGFTLIEILVAVVLLSLSLAAMVTLWGVSRKITERTRDTAEYYAIARQEAERFRIFGYQNVFNEGRATTTAPYTFFDPSVNPLPAATVWPAQYYDEKGSGVGTAQVAAAFYRVTSQFALVSTSGESGAQRLGVQKIDVYSVTNSVTPVYTTRMVFTAGGI